MLKIVVLIKMFVEIMIKTIQDFLMKKNSICSSIKEHQFTSKYFTWEWRVARMA